MADQTAKILENIKIALRDEPLSISEISEKLSINWRTAENNLRILESLGLVFERNIKNRRTFFYKEKNNYFDLPVKNEDIKKINTIYHHIKEFCKKFYNQEPTKTQAYKVIWKINKELKLNLPIGWYMYGPLCVQEFCSNEPKEINFAGNTISLIEKTTKEFCSLDNFKLQKKVYNESDENLYLTKEKLISGTLTNKEDINSVLVDLIKYAPPETVEVVTDFARATLLVGLEKTLSCFLEAVWKYVTLVRFRDSLTNYYQDLSGYMKIDETKKEAQLRILDIVKSHVKSK